MKFNNSSHNLAEWYKTKLSVLGDFSKGAGIGKAEVLTEGLCAIRYGELYTTHHIKVNQIASYVSEKSAQNSIQIHRGDIIFAGSGETIEEIGKSAVYLGNERCYAGGDTIIFTPKKVDPLFLAYFLNSELTRKMLWRLGQGQSVVHIYKKDLSDIEVTLPPLTEQKHIVRILETWDKAIALLSAEIECKATCLLGIKDKLLSGASRLPSFSKSWKHIEIGEVASSITALNTDGHEYPVLSCTKYAGLVRSLEYFGRKVFGDDLTKYKIVKHGQFAYATNHIEEGSIGYQDFCEYGLTSPMYTVFQTKSTVDDYFLYHLLKTPRMIYHYQSNMSGSIARRGGLRWSTFATLPIFIPAKEEQTAIANVISTAENEIELSRKKLEMLSSQRSFLLNNLVTGKIRTPETMKA